MLNFEPISLDKQKLYNEYFSVTPEQSADYTFVNLFGLKDSYSLEWAFDEKLVWIRQRSPYTLYWAPVGNWNEVDFCKHSPCEVSSEMLLRIPKTLAIILSEKTHMKIKELRDEWEYVYSITELVSLSGNKFHKKKNLCNQFEKNDYIYKPIDSSMVNDILTFEDKWAELEKSLQTESNSESNDENIEAFDKTKIASHEVRAEADIMMIKTLLKNWDKIDSIMGGVLLIDNKIVAYTIACGTMRDTLVIHSERGDRAYKGSYQAINRIFLKHNSDGKYKFVNREQDVGDLGLRKSKLSYNPVGFVEKYSGHCDCSN